jgi:hypothetical protein
MNAGEFVVYAAIIVIAVSYFRNTKQKSWKQISPFLAIAIVLSLFILSC